MGGGQGGGGNILTFLDNADSQGMVMDKDHKGVFRTLSNIYSGVFCGNS